MFGVALKLRLFRYFPADRLRSWNIKDSRTRMNKKA